MPRILKRTLVVLLAIPGGLVLLMGGAFAIGQLLLSSKSFPPATGKPNWELLAQEEIPSVVTIDPDGDRRITQVWIVAVENLPYLRTSDTKWFANIQRKPVLELRIGGAMYSCGTQVVKDQARAAAVSQAFYAKYPRRSAMFRFFGISTDTVLALTCNAGPE